MSIPELLSKIKKELQDGLLVLQLFGLLVSSPEKHHKPETGKPNKEVPETDKTPFGRCGLILLTLPSSHRCYHERNLASSGTQPATVSQPFFQCHSLEALLCIPLSLHLPSQ